MHGPLSEIGLIEVLQLIERGGRSGMLRLTGVSPGVPCLVHIRAGSIVALEPAASDDATRRALVARHLVSAAEADEDPAGAGTSGRASSAGPARRAGAGGHGALAARALRLRVGRGGGRPARSSPDALVFDLVNSESRRVDVAPLMDEFRAVPDFTPANLLAGRFGACAHAARLAAPRQGRRHPRCRGDRNAARRAAGRRRRIHPVAAGRPYT